jgi:hypothetical protein
LYYTTDEMSANLRESKRISCIFAEAKELVKLGYEHLDRNLGMEAASNIGPLIRCISYQIFVLDIYNYKYL